MMGTPRTLPRSIPNDFTLYEAAKFYLGFKIDPFLQTPASLGVGAGEASRIVDRQLSEIEILVKILRGKVHSGEIMPNVRHNYPNGIPDEHRTAISVGDLIAFAHERDDAAEPLRTLVGDWRRDRGIPDQEKGTSEKPGRPSSRGEILAGLEQLSILGLLTQNAKEDRRLVMARLKLPDQTPGWSVCTFRRFRQQFLRMEIKRSAEGEPKADDQN